MNHIQITQHQKNLVVLDIDGCVIDSDDRLPHFLNGDRETYDGLYRTDKTIPCGHIVYSLFLDMVLDNPQMRCIFGTGRSERTREYTTAQLEDIFGCDINQSRLIMRPLGCDEEHDLTVYAAHGDVCAWRCAGITAAAMGWELTQSWRVKRNQR